MAKANQTKETKVNQEATIKCEHMEAINNKARAKRYLDERKAKRKAIAKAKAKRREMIKKTVTLVALFVILGLALTIKFSGTIISNANENATQYESTVEEK